jgi:hypothetical protein
MNDIHQLDVRGYLQQILWWLRADEPFFHTRWNDGEWCAMFNLRTPDQTNGAHHYVPELCTAMLQTFNELADAIVDDPSHILLGTARWICPGIAGLQEFDKYIRDNYLLMQRCRWTTGEVWWEYPDEVNQSVTDKGLIAMFDELRTDGHHVVLVSNEFVRDARYCMGADFICTPPQESWQAAERILAECKERATPGTVFVWCLGFPGKVLSWQLWKEFPDTSHMDLGHLFEGICGNPCREWLRLKTGPHYEYQERVLKPYVFSFVPED